MAKIYVAWYDIVVPTPYAVYNKHVYLVKDDDGIISAGQTVDQVIRSSSPHLLRNISMSLYRPSQVISATRYPCPSP